MVIWYTKSFTMTETKCVLAARNTLNDARYDSQHYHRCVSDSQTVKATLHLTLPVNLSDCYALTNIMHDIDIA